MRGVHQHPPHIREFIRDAVLAGKYPREISNDLAAKGITVGRSTIQECQTYRLARQERERRIGAGMGPKAATAPRVVWRHPDGALISLPRLAIQKNFGEPFPQTQATGA